MIASIAEGHERRAAVLACRPADELRLSSNRSTRRTAPEGVSPTTPRNRSVEGRSRESSSDRARGTVEQDSAGRIVRRVEGFDRKLGERDIGRRAERGDGAEQRQLMLAACQLEVVQQHQIGPRLSV
jgi:hypothetical protein